MREEKRLSWEQKSDLENRELLVIQSTTPKAFSKAILGLTSKETEHCYERELISSLEPAELSMLILRGYETPDFEMRQISNKALIDIGSVFKRIKLTKNYTESFWKYISFQSDTLLEKIEYDIEAILSANSKSNEIYKNLLVTHKLVKTNSAKYFKAPRVKQNELQLGF